MDPAPVAPGHDLERFREYLLLLTRLHWDKRLQGKLDASDLVQQTLLEAFQNRDQCQARDEAQIAAWLRRMLARNLLDAVRRFCQGKRDVARERSLEADLEDSSSRLQAWLADEQSSPSQRAVKEEELLRLTNAIAQLPQAQRDAVELHHFKELSLAELAKRLGRTEASVAGLLRRGLKRLRELLQAPE